MDYIPDVSHEGEERKRKRGNTVGLHILTSSNTNTHTHASSATGNGPDLWERKRQRWIKKGERKDRLELDIRLDIFLVVSISVVLCPL